MNKKLDPVAVYLVLALAIVAAFLLYSNYTAVEDVSVVDNSTEESNISVSLNETIMNETLELIGDLNTSNLTLEVEE